MAWSFSALEAYETCPARYYHTRVVKDVADPPGEEAQWGTRVHKVLEDRIKTGEPITGTLASYEPYAAALAALPGTIHAEQQVALDKDLKQTTWFSKTVWVRAVIDVAVDNGTVLRLFDYKTGKRKPDSQQLKLSAAIGFSIYPEAMVTQTAFLWLKDKVVDQEVYTREQTGEIWSTFMPRVQRLEAALVSGTFPEKPSGLCRRWCPVRQCKFHGV